MENSIHTIDFNLNDYEVYYEEEKKLLVLSECHMSTPESYARYFLKNTKLNLSEIEKNSVIRLEGRRISHNTDDWLSIHNNIIEHFQGSSTCRTIYGINTYGGSTYEHALLTKFVFKFTNSIPYPNSLEYTIHVRIKDKEFYLGFMCSRYCNPNEVYCREYDPEIIRKYDEEEIKSREEYKRLNPNVSVGYFGGLGRAFKNRDIDKCIDIQKIIKLIKKNNNKIEIIK